LEIEKNQQKREVLKDISNRLKLLEEQTNALQTTTSEPTQTNNAELNNGHNLTSPSLVKGWLPQADGVVESSQDEEPKQSYTLLIVLGAVLASPLCATFYLMRRKLK
jgi:uncharacterized protein (DUF1800 family)